jgi:uncharacterized membrane protein
MCRKKMVGTVLERMNIKYKHAVFLCFAQFLASLLTIIESSRYMCACIKAGQVYMYALKN